MIDSNGNRWMAAAALVLTWAVAGSVRAETPGADKTKELEEKVEVLTEEVERLKHGPSEVEAKQSYRGMGPAASKVYFQPKGVSLGGYGEIVYENKAKGKVDETDALRAILYTGYRFSDSILFNSEIEFEHALTEANKDKKEGVVETEFVYLDFLLNPRANIRAGLMLIPVGFLNEAHEPVIFQGVLRPEVERNIIPTTWRENGLGLYGDVIEDLGYKLYLTNGLDARGFSPDSGIRGGRQSGNRARINDLATTARLSYRGLPGASFGTSLFYGGSDQGVSTKTTKDKITVSTADGGTVNLETGKETQESIGSFDGTVTLFDVDAGYQFRGLELRALYASFSVKDADVISKLVGKTVGERGQGFYVEGAFNVMSLFSPERYLTPFVRFEKYNTHSSVSEGSTADKANDRTKLTLGATFKPIPNVAIKADFQDKSDKANKAANQFNAAVTYNF